MSTESKLQELPEVIPLYRVSPLWRVGAIAACLLLAAFALVCTTLAFMVADLQSNLVTRAGPAAPVAPFVVTRPAPFFPQGQPEEANLPYPTRQDLTDEGFHSEEPPFTKDSARQRFLALGVDVSRIQGQAPENVGVSPDGIWMAYVQQGRLYAGPIGSANVVNDVRLQTFATPGGGMPPTAYYVGDESSAVGLPVWWTDSPVPETTGTPKRTCNYVCCLNELGEFRRFALDANATGPADWQMSQFRFRGDPLLPVPHDENKLVFVRTIPGVKVAGTGRFSDTSEISIGDQETGSVRTIVPVSSSRWQFLSISPDGKFLAAASNRGYENELPRRWRIFVVGIDGGEPEALTPPAARVGPISWTADGSALVYARSQDPSPPENWQAPLLDQHTAFDLYSFDIAAKKETRLSRGGGFFSQTVTENGNLYYLTCEPDKSGSKAILRHMPLKAAIEFAGQEPEAKPRDQSAWRAIFDEVLPPKTKTQEITPAKAAALEEAFLKACAARFHLEPTKSPESFTRLCKELRSFPWSEPEIDQLALVLGAVQGQFLVRKENSRWNLGNTVRLDDSCTSKSENESPFAMAINPFALARCQLHEKDGSADLSRIVREATGRPLVLCGDITQAAPALAGFVDVRLAEANKLFKDGEAEKGEQMLLQMLADKRQAGNHVLALRAAELLQEYGRNKALREVMEKECETPLANARRYNMLGVARLKDDVAGAIDAFKFALRSDLQFDEAYLNLALAYQRSGSLNQAKQCLTRYLNFRPDGKYAPEVRSRLAVLDAGGGN
jgi:tetratricopeptide (TPR) repeat protein